jgi:hypothetical protein
MEDVQEDSIHEEMRSALREAFQPKWLAQGNWKLSWWCLIHEETMTVGIRYGSGRFAASITGGDWVVRTRYDSLGAHHLPKEGDPPREPDDPNDSARAALAAVLVRAVSSKVVPDGAAEMFHAAYMRLVSAETAKVCDPTVKETDEGSAA